MSAGGEHSRGARPRPWWMARTSSMFRAQGISGCRMHRTRRSVSVDQSVVSNARRAASIADSMSPPSASAAVPENLFGRRIDGLERASPPGMSFPPTKRSLCLSPAIDTRLLPAHENGRLSRMFIPNHNRSFTDVATTGTNGVHTLPLSRMLAMLDRCPVMPPSPSRHPLGETAARKRRSARFSLLGWRCCGVLPRRPHDPGRRGTRESRPATAYVLLVEEPPDRRDLPRSGRPGPVLHRRERQSPESRQASLRSLALVVADEPEFAAACTHRIVEHRRRRPHRPRSHRNRDPSTNPVGDGPGAATTHHRSTGDDVLRGPGSRRKRNADLSASSRAHFLP